MKRMASLAATAVMVSLSMQMGCSPKVLDVALDPAPANSTLKGFPVPQHVRRLAVWYPSSSERDVADGYSRLEVAVFQLKKQRSWIKVVDRRNLQSLTEEQQLQLSGRVEDDSAVSIGKWLGADSIVLFRIDAPTWRERLLARFHEKMPSIVISSKIISVETGEVLYHDIVTVMPVPEFGKQWSDSSIDYELQPALRAALDQALSGAIAHLNQSFR
jgi:hypothetical protein